MKKNYKKLVSGTIVLTLMYCNSINAFAFENTEETQYIENHVDINLTNVNLAVSNGEDLMMSVDKSKNYFQQLNGENNIDKIKEIIKDYPEFEQDLIDSVEKFNDVAVIGCTEAPLEVIDGQLVRIEESDNSIFNLEANATTKRAKSIDSDYYYLTLTTWVNRYEYNKKTKQYHYMCDTEAYWSKNSILSGKKYPTSGEDYILQTVPKGFNIDYDVCTTTYDDGAINPKGSYRRVKSNSTYAYYAVEDDPTGWRQLKSASVITSSYAKYNKNSKRVNSYYVHTWKQLSLKASISVNTNKQVALKLTPSLKNKSWNLNNYVSFNF